MTYWHAISRTNNINSRLTDGGIFNFSNDNLMTGFNPLIAPPPPAKKMAPGPALKRAEKMITLAVTPHEWVSIGLDNYEDIGKIDIQLERNAGTEIHTFNGLKDDDFTNWLNEHEALSNAVLVVKNVEHIEDLTEQLMDYLDTHDYETLPTIVFFDKYGLPGITMLVHELYELRNGQLTETWVNW